MTSQMPSFALSGEGTKLGMAPTANCLSKMKRLFPRPKSPYRLMRFPRKMYTATTLNGTPQRCRAKFGSDEDREKEGEEGWGVTLRVL